MLTGDQGIDELKTAIDVVKGKAVNYSLEEQTGGEGTYSPLFATSVVSHGIDLEELNILIFQGIPYTTAEGVEACVRKDTDLFQVVMNVKIIKERESARRLGGTPMIH